MNDELFREAELITREYAALFHDLRARRNWDLCATTLLSFAATLVVLLVLHFMTLRFTASSLPVWLFSFALFSACWAALYINFNDDYRKFVKHRFLYGLAGRFGLTYRRGGVFKIGDLYEHHILPPYTDHDCEEGFSGKINGFRIAFQDFYVCGVPRLDRFDYRALSDYLPFYGIAIRVELNRHFQHHTVLMPSFLANGRLKRLFNDKFFEHENVSLISSKFRKRYTILSTNQVEARVIFDPATIERIMKLGDAIGAHWLEISFKGDEMVIVAGQTRNFFEPGTLLHPPTVLTVEKVLNEISTLKSVLEILELNALTGLGTSVPNRQ